MNMRARRRPRASAMATRLTQLEKQVADLVERVRELEQLAETVAALKGEVEERLEF